MTPAGETLAAEIGRGGPVTFRRFMEVALYHPEHGYYRRARDPFGKHGDGCHFLAARDKGRKHVGIDLNIGCGNALVLSFACSICFKPSASGRTLP